MRSFDWVIKHMVFIQQKEEHQINARFLESISSYIGIFSEFFIATSKMTNMKYYPCQGKIIPFVLFWETIEITLFISFLINFFCSHLFDIDSSFEDLIFWHWSWKLNFCHKNENFSGKDKTKSLSVLCLKTKKMGAY
jgi:hypothetical protein